jgi:glycosyltransferase involved in cell wall biosynthesis
VHDDARVSADVLLVALGSTAGLRYADEALAGSLRRAGVTVAVATAAPQSDVRTFVWTDLRWARAARAAAVAGIAEHAPRALVYSTTTAALLAPRPGAIRFDAPAAANRPGRHGLWQRPLERRRLAGAPLLLPWDAGGLAELPGGAAAWSAQAVVVPIPVEPSGPALPWADRDVTAITYAANPEKKGLDRVLAAWARAGRDGEQLVVCGIDAIPDALLPDGGRPDGVRCAGQLDPGAYRALLRRARVYVTAPRREDHGLAQLEALADGCALVTTASPGPYAALAPARALDPRWVVADAGDLGAALRAALDGPRADLATAGPVAVAAHRQDAVDRVVADVGVPRLLG